MHCKVGFAIKTNSECPRVSVYINGSKVFSGELTDACDINDQFGEIHVVEFDTVDDGIHLLSIEEENLAELRQTQDDAGFQVRFIELGTLDLAETGINSTTYNPVPGQGYMDHYIIPNNLEHEIIDGVHVQSGEHANYVNMPGGSFEFEFETPLYNWLLGIRFGKILSDLHISI